MPPESCNVSPGAISLLRRSGWDSRILQLGVTEVAKLDDSSLVAKDEAWLATLRPEQQSYLKPLLARVQLPQQLIEDVLAAETARGAEQFISPQARTAFRNNFERELFKLLCGDASREQERRQLEAALPDRDAIVAFLTTTAAQHLGIPINGLAPLAVLVLMTISRLGLDAWCATYNELQQQ
jgi:hypothetical protein